MRRSPERRNRNGNATVQPSRDRPAGDEHMRMGISLGGLILLILIIWLLFGRG
jgi:hypothetical protein